MLISGVPPSLVPGTMLSEHVGLKYAKIKWAYTQQGIGGGTRGRTVGGWDLAANKVEASRRCAPMNKRTSNPQRK